MSRNAKAEASRKSTPESESPQLTHAQQTRDMLESFAVAFILMLLIRTCLGENYQIPTGSMAPTLQGRHMDVVCAQCGYQYRTGASSENADQRDYSEVTATTCPLCRFPMRLDKNTNFNHRSFPGDRIIVSKLAYWMTEPERWDVIVFKCPADAKVNYIKRLIGLPGETLMIRHGDILVLDPATANEPPEQQRYRIARKPPDKVAGMLQLVDDTQYVGEQLLAAGWPSRWVAPSTEDATVWRGDERHQHFSAEARDQVAWLRYRHLVPDRDDWRDIADGKKPDIGKYSGMLITDYYEYNDQNPFDTFDSTESTNWVGDLAVECDVDVEKGQGELLLDLVEAGTHYTCRVDLSNGKATLEIAGGKGNFHDDQGVPTGQPVAETALQGAGEHRVRFANVDDQLFLWVDDSVVTFDKPTTFSSAADAGPRWSTEDPGDFMPAGVGLRGTTAHVSRLRILRDVYYLAISNADEGFHYADYGTRFSLREIYKVLTEPSTWESTELFKSRRHVTFTMTPNQFFPLGDNSPQSKDARLWSWSLGDGQLDPPPAVDRELLIGKAVFIYWPHGWRIPKVSFPFPPNYILVPNYQRMGFIH